MTPDEPLHPPDGQSRATYDGAASPDHGPDPRAGFAPHRVRLYSAAALVFDEVVVGAFKLDPKTGTKTFTHDLIAALEDLFAMHEGELRPVIEPVAP